MDSAVRRYGKPCSDAEAAEQVAKHLEAMGYNLDCESFITKDSSTNASKMERYVTSRTKVKTPLSKRASRYNFDNVASNDSSDDSDEEDDDDSDEENSDDSSDESNDDDDSSTEDSSEEDSEENVKSRYAPKKTVKQAIRAMKKKEIVKQMVKEAREPMDQKGREVPKAHLKYSEGRDGPLLLIAPKNDELHNKKVALPLNRKRSGLGRLFKRKEGANHSEGSHSANSQSQEQETSEVVSQSRGSMNGLDAIETQRSAATSKSADSKRSKGSKKSANSAKSPGSRNSGVSKKTENSTHTAATKQSSSSKNTDTSKKSKETSKSGTTKKSEVSAFSGISGKKPRTSDMTSVTTGENFSKSSSQTMKAGARSESAIQNSQLGIQAFQEEDTEHRQGSGDFDDDELEQEQVLEILESDDYRSEIPPNVIHQSESSEDGPIEPSTLNKTTGTPDGPVRASPMMGYGTIQATDTMLNEGRLEVLLPLQSVSPRQPYGVEPKTTSRAVADTQKNPVHEKYHKFDKEITPAVTKGQTQTSHAEKDQTPDVNEGPDPDQVAPATEPERPAVCVPVKVPKRKSFFRRVRTPRLSVDPQATTTTNQCNKSTERAVAPETQSPQQGQPSLAEQMPSNTMDEILIEGMSLVRQNELMDDQIFEGGVLDVIDIAEQPIQSEPLLISQRHQSSPRRLQHSSSPYMDRGYRRSPSRHKKKGPPKKKKMPQRSPSSRPRPHLQEPEPSPAPTVNFTFPPEEQKYEPGPRENEVEHGNGKKKVQIGKIFGKMFPRKEKQDKRLSSEAETPVELDLSLIEDDDGVDFRVRSPARSFEEKIGIVLEGDELDSDENPSEVKTPKSVAFADTVKVLTARHQDGAGIEAKIPSDVSLSLKPDEQLGEYLEVEVDNEENHVDEAKPTLVQSTTARKTRERQVTFAKPELSDSKANGGTEPSQVADMVTAFGDFMRSLTVSAEPITIHRAPIPIRPNMNKGSNIAGGSVSDANTVDTPLLQSEYPINCLGTKDEKKNKQTKQPVRSVSTLEGMRLAAMSPTRKVKYPTEDDNSFASQGSIYVLPSPESHKPLKSVLKSTATKGKVSNNTFATTPTSLNRRVRSTPQFATATLKKSLVTTPKGGQHANTLVGNVHQPIDTSLVGRMSSLKRETQKFRARHDPLSPAKILSPSKRANSNVSVMSPSQFSMNAIPDQEPLSPMNDGDSTVSSLKVPSNLATFTSKSKEWGVADEKDLVSQEEAARWAEVNNAANILGRVIGQVDVKAIRSTDTDDAQQLQRLLSDDSAVGDVEQALEILKRHAHRLGVRESDLLLAAAKSDDSEIFSVRSMTVGEELMEMVKSLFRGGATPRR
eukprot:scaffold13933_cov219-Amphora_coffeaeformis.AAC.9